MFYAVRGNKQLKIEEAAKETYLAMGYDIAKENNGKLELIQHAPNKTVPYAQYEKLQKENDELKARLEAAENSSELNELKTKLNAAEKKVKELEKQLKEAAKTDPGNGGKDGKNE